MAAQERDGTAGIRASRPGCPRVLRRVRRTSCRRRWSRPWRRSPRRISPSGRTRRSLPHSNIFCDSSSADRRRSTRRAACRTRGWGDASCSSARSRAHRGAQDQQRSRPGPARAADGQVAHHRRDRRGAARRGDRHRLRAARSAVCRLHGCGRHGAPGAQRLSHAYAGRGSRGVDCRFRTLKDAINEAMRDWVATVEDTYYLLGSALGPHPYPRWCASSSRSSGEEARVQFLAAYGRLPDAAVACVGGGSNAIGLFDAFVADRSVRLIGIEAGGEGIATGRHAARFAGGTPGVLQGTRTYVLQDAAGNIELRIRSRPASTIRRRPRARRPAAARPSGVPVCDRPGGACSVRRLGRARGHPARARIGTCDRRRWSRWHGRLAGTAWSS